MDQVILFLNSIALILIFVPSNISFLLYIFFYIKSRKYVEPRPSKTNVEGVVSVILPVRKEPLEYIDEALKSIYDWGLGGNVEVIIVSDDPYEYYLKIDKLAQKWKTKGLNVYVIWRRYPRGFKAGALNTALWFSRGKYVYVMDVDSRVSRDFIVTASNILRENNKVVAVVARWHGRNRDTRIAEAISASMKVVVDSIYRGRSALGLPVYPLGTGTLYKAGFLKNVLHGWDEERYLAEDLEIGCRIMGLGGGILFLDSHKVSLDVPRKYSSFVVQQERWVSGAVDVLLTRLKYILKSPQPWYAKLDLIWYLLQYFPAISTLLGALILMVTLAIAPYDVLRLYWYLGLPWVVLAGVYGRFYIESLRSEGYGLWRSVVNLGRSAAITTALTPVFTKAFFKSLFRIKMEFKRTPKGRYESIWRGLRFPYEALIGIMAFLYSIYLLIGGLSYTGGWFLIYSLGYIYSVIRWWREILFKPS